MYFYVLLLMYTPHWFKSLLGAKHLPISSTNGNVAMPLRVHGKEFCFYMCVGPQQRKTTMFCFNRSCNLSAGKNNELKIVLHAKLMFFQLPVLKYLAAKIIIGEVVFLISGNLLPASNSSEWYICVNTLTGSIILCLYAQALSRI